MNDREKVIRGLECCVVDGPACPDDCPYIEACDSEKRLYVPLMADALAILKAQWARVMTLEEVMALPTYTLQWMEFHFKRKDEIYRMTLLDNHRAKNRMDKYGKTWRCWTSKPTDEERAATPWGE